MSEYVDKRGWHYKVMPGLGGNTFKARYRKPDCGGWHCVKSLPWRGTEQDAQADLDQWAERKGFKEADCEI